MVAGAAGSVLKGGANLYLKATDPIAAKIEHGLRRLVGHAADHRDMVKSLQEFVESGMKRRRLRGKHTTELGPGKAYIQNHDDTDHAYMSYMDVESWMSSTQNKDDLIQNLFKRPNFKQWLCKTYRNVNPASIGLSTSSPPKPWLRCWSS